MDTFGKALTYESTLSLDCLKIQADCAPTIAMTALCGEEPPETTGIIVVGGGPTGALLSALLGRLNVPNVVLEREPEITEDPRGIALDLDGIRMIQAIGMYERVFTRIGITQKVHYIGGWGTDLARPPFLVQDVTTSAGGNGHVSVLFHKQPELERALRDAVSTATCSEIRSACKLVGVEEDDSMVRATYEDHHGETRTIQASFLVGADGKTGFVRKCYLEPKGIVMERCGGKYDETWVAMNWRIHLPTRESHPEFPLWERGMTPEDVYNAFFPKHFNFVCHPSRPVVGGRFGLENDRLWRWEFPIQGSEDPCAMSQPEETAKIIFPYITHRGDRYGLDPSVEVKFPEDCIETIRSRPFTFSARSCNKWASGRVMIAGDAAHVFPPFGGQGIASGFRDASSLAWRLAHLYREARADHEMVLRAWYMERKQQFERSLALTLRSGALVNSKSVSKTIVRDCVFWLLNFVPRWKQALERGPDVGLMTRYQYQDGFPFLPEFGGGVLSPQVYARNLTTGKIVFSDDLIFGPSKSSILQLLVLLARTEDIPSAMADIQGVSQASSSWLREGEATILIHDFTAEKHTFSIPSGVSCLRIASGEEFSADETLCRNRPRPKDYEATKFQIDLGSRARYVILRYDRYVYAACSSRDELFASLAQLGPRLGVS